MKAARIVQIVLLAMAVGFLALLNSYSALLPSSVVLYAGAILAVAGALNVVRPIRLLGFSRRTSAVMVSGCGLALVAGALLWPATTTRITERQTLLDDFLPEYEFNERHEVLVHATPEWVGTALQSVTFDEIAAVATLMRIRAIAMGQPGKKLAGGNRSVLQVMSHPHSGFLPLTHDSTEIVLGSVGRYWSTDPQPHVATPAEFLAFVEPGNAQTAFNLRVQDLGGGWTRLTTETRVHAIDATARKPLAAYWRAIFPGSAIIRHMWLEATRRRAERGRDAAS